MRQAPRPDVEWHTCSVRTAGWSLDPSCGIWKCGNCRKPSRATHERLRDPLLAL